MGNWRFGAFPKLPYSTMQQLNLDWILDRIRRFLPDNGSIRQVLTRTKDGAAWQDIAATIGAVESVNGMTGDVVLTASDVGALPSSTAIPDSTSDLTNDSGFVTAAQAAAAAPVQSVNGKTGSVVLDAEDVGALPDSYAPSFGTRQEITLPFTTTESGFFEGRLRTNTQGRAYANFTGSETFDAIIDGYNVANGYITQSFPLKAGVTIPVPTTDNVYQAAYYWTPLI